MYCKKTDSFSGEVFKENFTDIFYTNLEQIAFSLAFPIKNSVKRKTSLFVEKKPKAKISLHIKIGDYLSSGDKIGEKESNIREPHYVSVASRLRSTYKCFQVQIKDMRLPCNPLGCKSKMIQCEALRCYAIRARRSRASAFECKSKICKPEVIKSKQAKLDFVPLVRHVLRAKRRKTSFCITGGDRSDTKRSFVITRCKKICKPRPRPSGKANKSKEIGPRTQLDLYGQQLRFARRFARKWDPLWLVNRRFAFAPSSGNPLHRVITKLRFVSDRSQKVMHHCKAMIDQGKALMQIEYLHGHGKKVTQSRCKGKNMPKGQKNNRTPLVLTSSGRVVMISKNQLVLQKTQPVLFYDSANLHVKKGEFVLQGAPLLTLTHQTLITGDIVQGIPRIEQLFEAFTSPQKGLKDKKRLNVHDTLHSQVRDIFRKNWLKNVLSVAVRKSLEEIGSILLEMIQKVYLSQGVLISDKHIEIIIRQMTSKGQILDSGSTGLLLEEVLPIRQIENANVTTPGKKCLYVPSVVGLTAAALTCDSFISAASFQETTRVLSRDAVVGKTDFLRGLKEKVVIGDLISAGTGLDIYFVYTLFSESFSYVQQSKTGSR